MSGGSATPVPSSEGDLDALVGEARRQLVEVEALVGALDEAALRLRPVEGKWSVLQHVAHLGLVNEPYLPVMRERIAAARDRGDRVSPGPYRHPLVGRWFARSMEPPPKRRVSTLAAMVPAATLDTRDVLGRFRATQESLIRCMQDARGLDLGRIRFASPFSRLLRLSLGTAVSALLAHNRRHVWLIREVLESEGFPTSAGGSGR